MKQYYIIEYLNCKKDFQEDSVQFKGPQAYEKALTWGKKNLDNFNVDMIRAVDIYHPLKALKSKKSKE